MTTIRQVSLITYAGARAAVAAALEHAAANGWRVAVAVCDPSGGLVAFGRDDRVPLPVGDFAIDKAFTAATLGRTTRAFGERMGSRPALSVGLATRKRLLAWPGGLPIEIDGAVVGGIGVSGAVDEEDEQCATVAIRHLVARVQNGE